MTGIGANDGIFFNLQGNGYEAEAREDVAGGASLNAPTDDVDNNSAVTAATVSDKGAKELPPIDALEENEVVKVMAEPSIFDTIGMDGPMTADVAATFDTGVGVRPMAIPTDELDSRKHVVGANKRKSHG